MESTTLAPPSAGRRSRTWLTEPARPDWLRQRPNAHYYVLATVCVGAFMGQLDSSIVTVAFPTLQHTFHTSLQSVTWVGLSYLIVLVGGVTAVGRVSDMVGRKLLYTYGFVVFIIGSGLCVLAPNLLYLNGFRVIQAVGAAMLQANSVAIIYVSMPRKQLARGIGIQGAAQALGLALGPVIGGLLLAAGGWRLIFFVNVPAGVLGTVAAWICLPRSRDLNLRTPFDWMGLGLFVPMIVSVLVEVSFANDWGWVSAPSILLVIAAVASGAVFIAHERRATTPMLDPWLFRQIRFAAGCASGFLSYAVLFGTMFAVPFFLERTRKASPGHVGLVLTALPVALGCVAPIAGRLVERTGTQVLTACGMALTAGALLVLGLSEPSGWPLVMELGLVGAGLGLFTPPNNAAIMSSAPRSHAGMASGVLNMTRGLGTAFGLAFTSLVLGAVSGSSAATAGAGGFRDALLVLAAIALVTALLAIARPSGSKVAA